MKRVAASLFIVLTFLGLGSHARADFTGFWGLWQPVDGSGNPINGFTINKASSQTFLGALSDDHTTLTLVYSTSGGVNSSIFFENNAGTPPSGVISYDWTVNADSAATYFIETGTTSTPSELHTGPFSGSITDYSYTTGNYFAFGNVGFSTTPLTVTITLTNFQYTGSAVPEPSTFALATLGLGVGGIAVTRRFRRATCR